MRKVGEQDGTVTYACKKGCGYQTTQHVDAEGRPRMHD